RAEHLSDAVNDFTDLCGDRGRWIIGTDSDDLYFAPIEKLAACDDAGLRPAGRTGMKDVINARVHRVELRLRLLDGANKTHCAERDRSANGNNRDVLPFASKLFCDRFSRGRSLLSVAYADDLCAEESVNGNARRVQSVRRRHGRRIQNQNAAYPE